MKWFRLRRLMYSAANGTNISQMILCNTFLMRSTFCSRLTVHLCICFKCLTFELPLSAKSVENIRSLSSWNNESLWKIRGSWNCSLFMNLHLKCVSCYSWSRMRVGKADAMWEFIQVPIHGTFQAFLGLTGVQPLVWTNTSCQIWMHYLTYFALRETSAGRRLITRN